MNIKGETDEQLMRRVAAMDESELRQLVATLATQNHQFDDSRLDEPDLDEGPDVFTGYGGIHDLKGQSIGQGRNTRTRETYDRRVNFQPGYDELARIVAGLGREVSQIKDAVTLRGAREYVNKVDKEGNLIRKNWSAHEADITGPSGTPDGIPEVFITDSKGNVKIINGFTLKKSKYPQRKAYRIFRPTKADRDGYSFDRFMQQVRDIGYNEDDGAYGYRNTDAITRDIGPEYVPVLQPELTPKDAYKQFVFQSVYDEVKDYMKNDVGMTGIEMAQVFNIALSRCYDRHVAHPILGNMGVNITVTKEVNRAKKKDVYRGDERSIMQHILMNDLSEIKDDVRAIIETVIPEVKQNAELSSRHKQDHARQLARHYSGRRTVQQASPA